MSVAMTTNLDLSSATVMPSSPLLAPVPPVSLGKPEPLSLSTSQPEPSAILPAPLAQAMPDPPPQPVARPAPAPLHRPPQTPEPAQVSSAHTVRQPQPPRHESEPIMHAIPSAEPASQMQELLPMPPQSQSNPMLVGASLRQEPAPPSLQNG